MFVTITCDDGFDIRHAGVVTQEHPSLVGRRIDAFVTQFAGKSAVAIVDVVGDTSEIPVVIVGRTAIDMVDGHTFRDWFTAPCYINSMGGKDALVYTKSIAELQINCFTVFPYRINLIRIYQYFSSVGIDANTDDAAYTVVDIEGYSGLGMHAYKLHADAVKEDAPLNSPFTWSNTQNTF